MALSGEKPSGHARLVIGEAQYTTSMARFSRLLPRTTAGWTICTLFILFLVANAAYLHRVPGLLGDEGSEGENVYELLAANRLTIMGERSYIGPLLDYVRVPFVAVFGYSPLALRVPMFLASLLLFLFLWKSLRALLGPDVALLALVLPLFSPVFLTYQRLGWAITLIPFFAALALFLLRYTYKQTGRRARYGSLLFGLTLGLGLHNHLLFAATAAALLLVWFVSTLVRRQRLFSWWPLLVGFWMAFGTQLFVLLTFHDDQGEPGKVAALFWEKFRALPTVLVDAMSGSSVVASYTGEEFPRALMVGLTAALVFGVALALVSPARRVAWLWLLGLAAHLMVLTFIIEYFTPRYFVAFALGVWTLAGMGYGWPAARLISRRPAFRLLLVLGIAVALTAWTGMTTLLPFLRTGGSTRTFPFGTRVMRAEAFVDTRSLGDCLGNAGTVSSESIHIRNRLQYLAHGRSDFIPVEHLVDTQWRVEYRPSGETPHVDERCPWLRHFTVTHVSRDVTSGVNTNP